MITDFWWTLELHELERFSQEADKLYCRCTVVSFSAGRLDARWSHAMCLEEWDEMETEWRRTQVLGMLSTFKYHRACACALPPVCPRTDRVYDNRSSFFFFLQELKPPRLSSDSLLTILTASLDVIAATYECTPPHINLSMSSSWCSSCSLVVMVPHCWWA